MNTDRDVLIQYRLDQAERTLRQASLLAENSEWDGVVNRSYYAMFYACLALLLTKGLGTSKHAGVIGLIDREFVRTGILRPEMSKSLHDAFNQRQKTDYVELASTGEARAREIICHAREFVHAVKESITQMLVE